MKRPGIGLLIASSLLASGCVAVGGYSSGRGFFLWPGGIVILVVVLLVLLLRRRR